MEEIMSPERLRASLAIKDLTNPKNGIHAINIAVKKIEDGLRKSYPESTIEKIYSKPEVSIKENYDDLLFPIDNAGRSSRYTRYITKETVLRTHTSSAAPNWLFQKSCQGNVIDSIVILPGMCYRRDVINKTHCGEPHQMDVWRISYKHLTRQDLIELIETILNSIIPGYKYRANEVNHPYTINGLEVEIDVDGNWLEVLECGEISPDILRNVNLDPKKYSGLALGMGLDRIVMIAKKIDDIRILRSNDSRIKSQMTNLDKYIKVSDQPATKRVLSYSTSIEKSEEDVCEEIRVQLGLNASFIEKIEYLEIPYEQLTESAKEKLGIDANQKNVVITLTFRSLENSLPRKTVNEWIALLYPKLNKGKKGYY
ncbi:MAG: hypothetical protein PHR47_01030 [Candidatus Pacebacteria bacterium]|nr:hypothetical protein [Candidatus Paceibacterota bacterium]